MPFSPRYEFITPFADESVRLLRENWTGEQGTKMLAEELFAILQAKIPKPTSGPITINLTGAEQDFIKLRDQYGGEIAAINFEGNLVKRPQRPPREGPTIVWAVPDPIATGTPLSGTQLNAVANDPISGYPLDGTYEYTPPSGTVLADGTGQPLNVVFTPTNSTSYKRSRKSVHIDVGSTTPTFGFLDWIPADMWTGGTLGASQLNAVARDANTNDEIVGTYDYTPASGATIDFPTSGLTALHCDFTPSSPADLITYGIVSSDVSLIVRGIYQIASLAQTTAVTIGDLIVVFVESGAEDVAVSATRGTFTQIGGYVTYGGTNKLSAWYAFASSTGANTVSVTGTSADIKVCNLYGGAISFDSTSNGSGIGGSTATAGTCPVGANREVIVVYATSLSGRTYLSGWSSFGLAADNAMVSFSDTNGATDPNKGTNSAKAVITGGTSSGSWAAIATSFEPRHS